MLSYSIFEKQFATLLGSFMKTTYYKSVQGHLCPVCSGLKQKDEVLCYQCSKTKRDAERTHAPLADVVRIGYYAVEDEPLRKIMHRYKEDKDQESIMTVEYILTDAFILHWKSLIRLSSGVTPTAWAIVPSSKSSIRHGQEHPLHIIAQSIFAFHKIPEVHISSVADKMRTFNPHAFTIDQNNPVDLSHVILIDDSWTTGNSVQSAASALKLYGAKKVTVYCIARIVNLKWWRNRLDNNIINRFLKIGFEPHNPWKEIH